MKLRPSLAVAAGLASLPACGAYTHTSRIQKPMIVVPPRTEIALVTVDVPREVARRAPSDFAKMSESIATALPHGFRGSPVVVVDQVSLGFTLEIEPTEPDTLELLPGVHVQKDPAPPEDVTYVAKPPVGLPTGVTSPLVLGVRVLDWRLLKREVGTKDHPRKVDNARVDLVYSLWTRDGREVETQRVKVDLSFMGDLRQALRLLPRRTAAVGMSQTKGFFFGKRALDRTKLFLQAIDLSARAFAFPYAQHEMPATAVWDNASAAVRPGIEMADKGNLTGAIDSWQRVLSQDPTNAPALFDIGMALVLRGEDAAAQAKFDEAIGIDAKSLYKRTRSAVQSRIDARRVVELPAED